MVQCFPQLSLEHHFPVFSTLLLQYPHSLHNLTVFSWQFNSHDLIQIYPTSTKDTGKHPQHTSTGDSLLVSSNSRFKPPGEPIALPAAPALYLLPKERKSRRGDGEEGKQNKGVQDSQCGLGGPQDACERGWELEQKHWREEDEEEMKIAEL